MGTEIERKFLVADTPWRDTAPATRLWQGYLSTTPERTVRIRIQGDEAMITVKGKTHGATRAEFEYSIPVGDAAAMLRGLCEQPTIEKTRYKVEHAGYTWDVDVFDGVNAGLMLAEVELTSEDEDVPLPPWVGEEVTEDPAYYNSNLIASPFTTWNSDS